MPRKPKEIIKEVKKEEPKVEFKQCLRCGGKEHEPTNECDAMK